MDISFSGKAPNDTGNAQVRLLVGLPAMQWLLITHKWVLLNMKKYLDTRIPFYSLEEAELDSKIFL